MRHGNNGTLSIARISSSGGYGYTGIEVRTRFATNLGKSEEYLVVLSNCFSMIHFVGWPEVLIRSYSLTRFPVRHLA